MRSIAKNGISDGLSTSIEGVCVAEVIGIGELVFPFFCMDKTKRAQFPGLSAGSSYQQDGSIAGVFHDTILLYRIWCGCDLQKLFK